MNRRDLALHVDAVLEARFPHAPLALRFESPLQLLVAVILSAQCTDERVNAVTGKLFARFPSAEAFAEAPLEELEALVRPTGFYRNKARMIKECCRQLVARFGGDVPSSMEDLTSLPGVGRKTANMVRGNAFGLPGIAVDTHVQRVTTRLGLSAQSDPEGIERDLMELLPPDRWTLFSNRVILFGREVCTSRAPACALCPFLEHCPSATRCERGGARHEARGHPPGSHPALGLSTRKEGR